jgi:hypothetical protein
MVKSSVVGEPEPFKLERFFAKVRRLFLLKSFSVAGDHLFQIMSMIVASRFHDLMCCTALQYEHAGPRPLCVSDCEPLKMSETLAMADPECAKLWENLNFAYTETAGHPLLREEIVKTHYPVCACCWQYSACDAAKNLYLLTSMPTCGYHCSM